MEVGKGVTKRSTKRSGRNGTVRRSRQALVENYYRKKHKVKAFYDEDQDYTFAERVERTSMPEVDFEWYEGTVGDTIDDMSTALNESQRRAVRWRIMVLRVLGAVLAVVLLSGALPSWVSMLKTNRTMLEHQHDKTSVCGMNENPDENQCVYYNHELSTYNAFVGMWMFAMLLQAGLLIFTSWKLHNKSFQALVSLWTLALIVVGMIVLIYSVVVLSLMAEKFNWRISGAGESVRIAKSPPRIKRQFGVTVWVVLCLDVLLILVQATWLFIMRQVLQYGLNLQEFGAEMCGADVVEAAHQNEVAMQDAVDSLLDDDSDEPPRRRSHRNRPNRSNRRELLYSDDEGEAHEYSGRGGFDDFQDLGEVDEYSYSDEDYNDLEDDFDARDNAINGDKRPKVDTAHVLEMLSALTTTMSALNQKIDTIESRVGDGSALLVMPPGENQWDAKKPGQ